MRANWWLLVPGIPLFVGAASASQAASFDCRKAATMVEITICADEQTGLLDERMGAVYRKAREKTSDPGTLVAEQRAWLRERNACTTKACLTRLYEQRISHLELANAAASAIPPQVAATPPTLVIPETPHEPRAEGLGDAVVSIDIATAPPTIDATGQHPSDRLLEIDPTAVSDQVPALAMTDPAASEETPVPATPNSNSELASAPRNVSALQTQGDAVPESSTAESVEWWRDYLPRPNERKEDTYRRHPTFYNWLAGYILVSGIFGLALVRPPLIRWYRSQFWFVRGAGPVDILLKQIWFRLGFELFTYALACLVGAFGGWLFVFLRRRGRPAGAIQPSVAMTGLD
jgi:uncharacterized protein